MLSVIIQTINGIKPQIKLWTLFSAAELRGIIPPLPVRQSERKGGLIFI